MSMCPHCRNEMGYEELHYGFDICESLHCLFCGTYVFGRLLRGSGNSIPHDDLLPPARMTINKGSHGIWGDYGGRKK